MNPRNKPVQMLINKKYKNNVKFMLDSTEDLVYTTFAVK